MPSLEEQAQIVAELEGYQQIILGARKVIKNYLPSISYTAKKYQKIEDIAILRPSKDEIRILQTTL